MFELFNNFSDHVFYVFDMFWIFLAYCSRINFLALFVLAAGDNLLDPQEGKLMMTVMTKCSLPFWPKSKNESANMQVFWFWNRLCVCDKLVLPLCCIILRSEFVTSEITLAKIPQLHATFNGFVPRFSLQLRGNHYRVRDLGWVLWHDLPDVQTKTDPKWCRQSQSHEIGNEEVQWCDPWVAGLKVRNMSSDCKLFTAPYWSH